MQFCYKDKKLERKGYLEGLVVNTERGKPHLVKGDILLLSNAGDEFHPFIRRPVSGLNAIDVSRSAAALQKGKLSLTHGLDAPFCPARKKIKASETMTD